MKTGKFITVGYHNNVKIGYGTVDHKNLKTVYLKLNSWVEPEADDGQYDSLLSKTRRKIKLRIHSYNNKFFKRESIVDLDLRTKGVKTGKKSFLNLEITLFSQSYFDIKSKEIKSFISGLSKDIIEHDLDDKNLFNFHKNKK